MEQLCTYTLPGTADSLRLTVTTVNTLQYGVYEAERYAAAAWFERETGMPVGSLDDGELPPDLVQPMRILDVALHRAYMLAALAGVEEQHGEAGPWLKGELPLAWRGVREFAEHVPAPLYVAWRTAAQACNPGVFWVDMSDDAKTFGGVSVITLTTPSPR